MTSQMFRIILAFEPSCRLFLVSFRSVTAGERVTTKYVRPLPLSDLRNRRVNVQSRKEDDEERRPPEDDDRPDGDGERRPPFATESANDETRESPLGLDKPLIVLLRLLLRLIEVVLPVVYVAVANRSLVLSNERIEGGLSAR